MTLMELVKTDTGTVGNYTWKVEWYRSSRSGGEKFKPVVSVRKQVLPWPFKATREVYSSTWKNRYSEREVANDVEVAEAAKRKAQKFQKQKDQINE